MIVLLLICFLVTGNTAQ